MIEVKFKNLERSELAKDAVTERFTNLTEKFADLKKSRLSVTIEMENSPIQAGPDLFSLKLFVSGGKYDRVTVTKADSNMYKALADLIDYMLEKLNRTTDKKRVKERKIARQMTSSEKQGQA